MHYTKVKMKDGTEHYSPIWKWRPKEGYFTLVSENAPKKIFLRDVESAVTENERVSINQVGVDRDELQRARKDGWDGD